ncbi:glycosyltransferase family 2 protein [Alphaproteobacteria bacterium]|nr:glycosyltransferase family 2 protein [Alphaproteobacteria bacterium]
MSIPISIVIPVYNEEGSIVSLISEVCDVFDPMYKQYEVIVVNDGSTDATLKNLEAAQQENKKLIVINLARNFGQTAATAAGIDYAQGKIIVGLDGDGQNDPNEFPKMLALLEEGFDVVCGWRMNRKDKLFTRKIPSAIANSLISRVSGVQLRDYGCSQKVYRREFITNLKLMGDMHRFIPIYLSWMGGKVTEVGVNHRPRTEGVSKYGLNRTFKVILDILLIRFLYHSITKPMHFFGGFGLLFIGFGLVSVTIAILLKIFYNTSLIQTPLPLMSAISLLLGCVTILLGIIAELIVKVYYSPANIKPYLLAKKPLQPNNKP